MNSRIPIEIQPLISDFSRLLRSKLPNAAIGLYLQGSVVLQGFNKDKSDIDFVVVFNHECTEDELLIIQAIHEELKGNHRSYMVAEGQYTTLAHLNKTIHAANDRYPKFYYGQYEGLRNGWLDPTALWIVKYEGIAVFGPEVNELDIVVDWNDLLYAMKYNLHHYWTNKAQNVEIFMHDDWIDFTVLTLGRIMFTLQNKSIITKEQGGYYLLKELLPQWHPLIHEALQIRKGAAEISHFGSKEERAFETQKIIHFIINLCNKKYNLLDHTEK
ncbi:putative nucleotidyltransferase [Paenibacillus castaneae]|uniref:nucleotidyltransferase domain-containing protein n=1 Tax=Paenibacillus castaneae TaxID=474957 RepID=UPI00141BB461|nr:nucleotidyltransferase domain-containing protein [Paenibacillus castaneae]NIK75167.1 putative nucleotidyltransferase [Paenibacillus castaneae]